MSGALEIVRIPVLSDNYVWLVHDGASGETVVVDPSVADPVLEAAHARGWTISQIWNTHWHGDHIGGNAGIVAAPGDEDAQVELTYNWPTEGKEAEVYTGGRNFGHLAYRVENIYETCQRLMDNGVTINRPPRDGHMAFVRTPDGISIELLQDGHLEPAEPWASMPNTGQW